MNELTPLLFKEHDADGYIREMKILLEDKKSSQIHNILNLNLFVAYCQKKEYHTAKELLLQINTRKLSGITNLAYWIYMAYVHFYLLEDDKALLILEQQRIPFTKQSSNPGLGGMITILLIFELLAKGDKTKARELLEQTRPHWENEHNASDFDYLDKLC